MSLASLLLVDTPRDPFWELDWISLSDTRTGLLTWVTAEPSTEPGVPPAVSQALARAFCRAGLVTYLCSQVPPSADGAWRNTPVGSMCRIRATSIVQRQFFPLLATRKPEVAAQLFDDEQFSWVRRTQVVMLSDATQPPLALDWGILDGITGSPLQTNKDRLQHAGVQMLVLPGIGGDVAGFYFLDETFGSVFVQTLQNVCADYKIAGAVLPEQEILQRFAPAAPPSPPR